MLIQYFNRPNAFDSAGEQVMRVRVETVPAVETGSKSDVARHGLTHCRDAKAIKAI
jgi:hypothetical protein